jgi:hypothetical protein
MFAHPFCGGGGYDPRAHHHDHHHAAASRQPPAPQDVFYPASSDVEDSDWEGEDERQAFHDADEGIALTPNTPNHQPVHPARAEGQT